jgi:hypothetical protein
MNFSDFTIGCTAHQINRNPGLALKKSPRLRLRHPWTAGWLVQKARVLMQNHPSRKGTVNAGRAIKCGRVRLDLAYPKPVRLLVHRI